MDRFSEAERNRLVITMLLLSATAMFIGSSLIDVWSVLKQSTIGLASIHRRDITPLPANHEGHVKDIAMLVFLAQSIASVMCGSASVLASYLNLQPDRDLSSWPLCLHRRCWDIVCLSMLVMGLAAGLTSTITWAACANGASYLAHATLGPSWYVSLMGTVILVAAYVVSVWSAVHDRDRDGPYDRLVFIVCDSASDSTHEKDAAKNLEMAPV